MNNRIRLGAERSLCEALPSPAVRPFLLITLSLFHSQDREPPLVRSHWEPLDSERTFLQVTSEERSAAVVSGQLERKDDAARV